MGSALRQPSQPEDQSHPVDHNDKGGVVDREIVHIYQDLRNWVEQHLRAHERANLTLQPTEVVHEAYLRLRKLDREWVDDCQVRAAAAKIIRDVLVDYARRRASQKRGGDWRRRTLIDAHVPSLEQPLDLLALHTAMEELKERRPDVHDVILLRVFGGMTVDQVAKAMNSNRDRVNKHWAFGRALLNRLLR